MVPTRRGSYPRCCDAAARSLEVLLAAWRCPQHEAVARQDMLHVLTAAAGCNIEAPLPAWAWINLHCPLHIAAIGWTCSCQRGLLPTEAVRLPNSRKHARSLLLVTCTEAARKSIITELVVPKLQGGACHYCLHKAFGRWPPA
ncbi:hypothetical protein Dimus_025880 [Dionaea muscipula]